MSDVLRHNGIEPDPEGAYVYYDDYAALREAEAVGLEKARARIQEAREEGESDLRSLLHWCRAHAAALRAGEK